MKVVEIDKISFKGEPEEEVITEAEHLKSMFSLPASLCGSYLKFIQEKGLLKEYIDWRTKKVMELI